MELRTAVNEFIEERESYGRKPATLRFYHTHLGSFIDFLKDSKILLVSDLTHVSMRKFFVHLQRRGLAQDTIAAYDRVLRAFCRFCVARAGLKEDPMKDRPRIKQNTHSLPDTLEPDEIARMLATCGPTLLDKRDRAIMLLLLDTGMRAGEVCALTPDHVTMNGDRGEIFISASTSKGKEDRTVMFWSETLDALATWLAVRPDGSKTVFVASNGGSWTTNPLTPSGLNQMLRRRARRAGVTGKKRLCHIWRHTFAKMYVKGGGDLETLRRLLGHQSLDTVQKYLRFKIEELAERHYELSPVRQLYSPQKQKAS
jgi:site-specific recombinase XerD